MVGESWGEETGEEVEGEVNVEFDGDVEFCGRGE